MASVKINYWIKCDIDSEITQRRFIYHLMQLFREAHQQLPYWKHNQKPTSGTSKHVEYANIFYILYIAKQSVATSAVWSLNRWTGYSQTLTSPASCCVHPCMISEHQHHLTSPPATAWDQRGVLSGRDLLAAAAREGIYRRRYRRSDQSGRQGLDHVCLTMLI